MELSNVDHKMKVTFKSRKSDKNFKTMKQYFENQYSDGCSKPRQEISGDKKSLKSLLTPIPSNSLLILNDFHHF